MDEPVFSWPVVPPRQGQVLLREFRADDVGDIDVVVELSSDSYLPLVTSLVAGATRQEATEWIRRQLGRLAEGTGFSFAIADSETDRALGQIGLWLKDVRDGRTSVGYAVTPSARGRGVAAEAVMALTGFAWTLSPVHRIELYIEPWNTASIRTAERAGYHREGLLRSHQEIGGSRRDMLLYAAIRPDETARP